MGAKVLVYGDNHWCQYSSIIRTRGKTFSTRLENQIESLNWVEHVALDKGCGRIICLGDFFDRDTLNGEEITALSQIKWSGLPHTYLVGNHEISNASGSFASSYMLGLRPSTRVEGEPYSFRYCDTELCFLPYFLEADRKPLKDIFGEKTTQYRIIFSHNDIAGIRYGNAISKIGYSVEEIDKTCDLFLNGHLHNGGNVTEKLLNVGNLTGQNFSEDASKYTHGVIILDVETLEFEFIENPFAFNFYKLPYDADITALKNNAVITMSVPEEHYLSVKERIDSAKNVVASRLLVEYNKQEECVDSVIIETVDHLKKFKDYISANFGNTADVQDELGALGI